jgi:hypothetical protein
MSAVASAAGGEAENICSVRALPVMTPSGLLEPRVEFIAAHEVFRIFGLFLWQAG